MPAANIVRFISCSHLKHLLSRVRFAGACPIDYGLPLRRSRDPMERLHRIANRRRFARGGRLGYALFAVTIALFWPFRSLELACATLREAGRSAHDISGKSRARLLLESWALMFFANVSPWAYYQFSLYDSSPPRQNARDYLMNHEVSLLFGFLCGDAPIPEVDDKLAFQEFCERENIPCPPLVARLEAGIWGPADVDDPCSDVFVKPAISNLGRGGMLWRRREGGLYEDTAGRLRCWPDLLDTLAAESGGRNHLLQSALHPHPDLAGVSNGCVPVARIISNRAANGLTEVFIAVLRMPTGGDHTTTNGLTAPITLDDGTLGEAVCQELICAVHTQHPDAGGLIPGTRLPDWQYAVSLVVEAHRALGCCPFLGWDVAFSDRGAFLLEPNKGWEVLGLQRAHNVPLGRTSFPHRCLRALEEMPAGQRR